MLSYYRQSLTELFAQVQVIKDDPHGHRDECLDLQESLIKKTTYVEQRIRKLRSAIKTHKRKLGTACKDSRLNKEEARRAKREISRLQSQIDDYKYLLAILKDIGNGIAFAYIDKWDIKPMAFKEPAGFISGKKGARRERKIWRALFEHGLVAVLNDLTHCLRYGDITVCLPNGKFTVVEVKSSERHNKREKRQIEELERITNYIYTDRTDHLYQLDGEVRRVPLLSNEVNHQDKMNCAIKTALENGCCLLEVERGLFYFAATQSGYDPKALEPLANQQHKGEIWMADISALENAAYYPFTLSIRDPQTLYLFYEGTLSITVMVDSSVVIDKLQSEGFTLDSLFRDSDWAFEVIGACANENQLDRVRIGYHLLKRVYAEFLSLDWFLEQMIKLMKDSSVVQSMYDA